MKSYDKEYSPKIVTIVLKFRLFRHECVKKPLTLRQMKSELRNLSLFWVSQPRVVPSKKRLTLLSRNNAVYVGSTSETNPYLLTK